MKNYRFWLQLSVAVLLLSFGARAFADAPRDDIAHAYVLLKHAKHDYKGHRAAALHELEAISHELGFELKARTTEHENQMQSDEQVSEANRLLHEARDKMEARDRQRIANHIEAAIREVNAALRVK